MTREKLLAARDSFEPLLRSSTVGRSGLRHGGIVRDPVSRARAVVTVIDCLAAAGLGARGLIRSPIDGGDGNIEYLLWLRKGDEGLEMEVPV